MLRIKKNLFSGVWINYEERIIEDDKVTFKPVDDVKFKITPLDMRSADDFSKALEYCIIDWKGLVDDRQNELKFSEENRSLVYHNVPHFIEWLSSKVVELNKEVAEILKN